MNNFYQMKRGWQDHPIFDGEVFSKRDAWQWLISAAAYKPAQKKINGSIVTLNRGQLSFSIRFLAEKWQWHRSKVHRFLCELKIETMIETVNETGQHIISICNYDDYQLKPKDTETASETVIETKVRQKRDKEEYNNNTIEYHNNNNSRASVKIDYEFFKQSWNQNLPDLTAVRTITETRKRHIRARLGDMLNDDPEQWLALLRKIGASDFLCGRGDKSFTASFDWVINPTNMAKILEGNYENRATRYNPDSTPRGARTDRINDAMDAALAEYQRTNSGYGMP